MYDMMKSDLKSNLFRLLFGKATFLGCFLVFSCYNWNTNEGIMQIGVRE